MKKKLVIFAFYILSCHSNLFAQTFSENMQAMKRDLTTKRVSSIDHKKYSDYPFTIYAYQSLKIDERACSELKLLKEKIRLSASIDIEEAKISRMQLINQCMVDVKFDIDKEKLAGFRLINGSKNTINTQSHSKKSSRIYEFEFDNQSSRNMSLLITEDSAVSGTISGDTFLSRLIFLPRRNFPYIRTNYDTLEVYLPTGEKVVFNSKTNEIISGVLKEAAMDYSLKRYDREFAGVKYNGRGIMIRSDRVDGLPELTYSYKKNRHSTHNFVHIYHKDKYCRVLKRDIWAYERVDGDTLAYFRYKSDEEFVRKVINDICGWKKVSLDDL